MQQNRAEISASLKDRRKKDQEIEDQCRENGLDTAEQVHLRSFLGRVRNQKEGGAV